MEKEFEDYWKAHQKELIAKAPAALQEERRNYGKMNTAGDWLLFIVPILLGVGFFDLNIIHNSVLNIIVALVVMVVAYVLTIMVKPYVTGKRDISDIENDIKQHFHEIYKLKGLKGLDSLLSGQSQI